jgi:type I restriction enzyme S subunit
MSVAAPTPEVPSDWDIAKAEDVCEVQNGFAFKSVHFNDKDEGLPLIRIRDVHKGFSKTYYSGEYAEKFVVSNGDLLVGMDGEFRVRCWGAGRGLLNQRVCRLLPVEGPMTKDFLYYSIGRPLKQIEDFTPFTTVKHISAKQIRAIELPLPPLPEQKKIAHILSTVQRAIEAQERIIQTTTELKKALMHKLFTEGLRNEPQKQTEIGPVPESWEVVPFDQFATLQRGYDLRKQDFRPGTIPVIGATQTIGYHDTANVKAPGVTVVRSGSSAGKPLFISEDFWAHNVVLFVKDFHGNLPKFVYYKILSLDLTQYRQGVAVPTLNRNTFSAIEVALPCLEEQQEIVDALDSVGTKTEVAERKKAQLQDLFRTLLNELMTAKTRVHKTGITL